MSKIVAGTAFVLLSGATVTGGVLLLGKKDGKTETPLDYDLPKQLSDFHKDDNKEGCVKTLFGESISLSNVTGGTIGTGDLSSPPSSFLGSGTQGCLVVNWDKKTKVESGSSSKWNGSIRFLWAVKGESKGFVVFLVGTATPDTSGNTHKIAWTGSGYLMEKGQSGDTWTAKKKLDVPANKHFPSTPSNEDKFPQPSDHLSITNNHKFWNFFSEVTDLQNIAADKDLTDATESSMKGYWEWQSGSGESSKKLSDWTKNLTTWWPDIFGDSANQAKEAIENQQGSWTQKHYISSPAKAQATGS